jgi:hypothetical protein
MRERTTPSSAHFEPLQTAPRSILVAGVVLGPLLWLVALAVGAWFFEYTWAIAVGLTVTVAAFVLALVVLALARRGRERQESRYVHRG